MQKNGLLLFSRAHLIRLSKVRDASQLSPVTHPTTGKTIQQGNKVTNLKGGEVTNRPTMAQDTRWVQSDGWCNLCNLPFTHWGEHVMPHHYVGHRMLEMVYDCMVRLDRTWNPRVLIYNLVCPWRGLRSVPEFKEIHSFLDKSMEKERRRIHLILMHFASIGVFDGLFDRARSEGNSNLIKGTNLAPRICMWFLLSVFPGYDSGYLSEIVQLICSHDNFKEVFSLLGGVQITQGFVSSKLFWESDYLRAILGELHNITIDRPRRYAIKVEHRSLAQYAFQACSAELVLRVIENLVSRVDMVWRRQYSAPFMNSGLPKGSPLNRQASSATVSRPAFRPELEDLQVNRFIHETWPTTRIRKSETCAPKPQYLRLGPHIYNTFRPRFSQFFREDSSYTCMMD